MQVSGVNEVFWSVLNGVLLVVFCLWLLDRRGRRPRVTAT